MRWYVLSVNTFVPSFMQQDNIMSFPVMSKFMNVLRCSFVPPLSRMDGGILLWHLFFVQSVGVVAMKFPTPYTVSLRTVRARVFDGLVLDLGMQRDTSATF